MFSVRTRAQEGSTVDDIAHHSPPASFFFPPPLHHLASDSSCLGAKKDILIAICGFFPPALY